MQGRDFVTPEDILAIVPPVFRHRIILSPDKEMEGITEDDVIKQIYTGDGCAEVGSGEWGVGSGEWGVGSGEWGGWGVGSGEWGVGSGEWGVASG